MNYMRTIDTMDKFEVIFRVKKAFNIKDDREAEKILKEYETWGFKPVKINNEIEYKWIF